MLHTNVLGRVNITIPADTARIVVLAPVGGELRRVGTQTLIDNVVVRYTD